MGHPTSVFVTPPDPNLKCAICLDIFSDPVSLVHCGHTFCHECLTSSMQASPTTPCCPECRAPINKKNKAHRVRVIESTIGNAIVRCRNAYLDDECHPHEYCPQECSWTGPLSQWPLHASRDCSVEIIQCPISGCCHQCTRGQMASHLGSSACIESAIESRMAPLQSQLDEMRDQNEKWNEAVEFLAKEKDEYARQNQLLAVENEWLRSKEIHMKQSEKRVFKLQREKKELMIRVQSLESRVKEEIERRMDAENIVRENSKRKREEISSSNCSHKKKKKGGYTGRIRAVSSGTELEVHAIF
ncbi:hypothetical protein HJC23_001352 [Cyclotella cryptica]|uniref:RING-type domain-containing protein n=1 Tax=Cyclotella cryptica TaxID=29204 RepID=A0ABD3PPA5_9STRA